MKGRTAFALGVAVGALLVDQEAAAELLPIVGKALSPIHAAAFKEAAKAQAKGAKK